MTYLYEVGAVRWKRHLSKNGDPRCHRAPKGWEASADVRYYHPTTGRPLRGDGQWWIREMFVGKD